MKQNKYDFYGQMRTNLQLTDNLPLINWTTQEGREACQKGPDGWRFTPRGAGAPPKAAEAACHGFTVQPGADVVRIVHAGDNLPKIWLCQALRGQSLKGPMETGLHGSW